ncbi:hypothetical protein [Saccharopolyspora phatthalungensis]|uniref:Uncharacterized protein n=1 Tax=Saccharopolyspora phatthalungensis TaxID=664693 RepID=A0A840QBS5_9PSEU|nr:hypothetical protein [Saccharopolyspora phatthalungensis]MBB5156098.1 hypothetical protein [Saccharopolyspora phatthalungensis]
MTSSASRLPGFAGHAAVITLFEVDRAAVLAGEQVTVRWRTEHAGTIRITPPDGFPIDLDAGSGSGSHQFVAARTGMIRAMAYGRAGPPAEAGCPIAVFELPALVPVPVPEPSEASMPVFARTPLPFLDRSALGSALLTASSGHRSLAISPAGRGEGRPAWTTTPARFLSVMPSRSPGRPARPIDLRAVFVRWIGGWQVMRRRNGPMRQGEQR